LVLFALRDIRKLVRGRLLTDDGVGAASVAECLRARPSTQVLQQILSSTRGVRRTIHSGVYSHDFFRVIESIVFLRMYSTVDAAFSKHKYLMMDAERDSRQAFFNLLRATAQSLSSSPRWPALFLEFREYVFFESDLPSVYGPLKDTAALLERGLHLEAVLPFRYALLVVHLAGSGAGEGHKQARASAQGERLAKMISVGLAVGEELPPRVLELVDAVLLEAEADLAHS
jgi:hypothetical protein